MRKPKEKRRANDDPVGRGFRPGDTIVNVITAIILIGLVILAISWVVRQWGQATQEYTEGMIEAKHDAESMKCQMNMRTIGQNIQIYSLTNEDLPESMDELRQFSGGSGLFKCPARDGAEYVYIAGQSREMSGTNVLVYEPNAVHNEQCSVLLLNGKVGFLSHEQLDAALKQTQVEMRSR